MPGQRKSEAKFNGWAEKVPFNVEWKGVANFIVFLDQGMECVPHRSRFASWRSGRSKRQPDF
jgi:hypothetical protein